METNYPIYIIGRIFTSNSTNDFIEGIVINNKIIVFTGTQLECEKYIKENYKNCNIIKLQDDQLLLPGFIDSHMHPLLGGIQKQGLTVFDP